jgi:hypothetical protein
MCRMTFTVAVCTVPAAFASSASLAGHLLLNLPGICRGAAPHNTLGWLTDRPVCWHSPCRPACESHLGQQGPGRAAVKAGLEGSEVPAVGMTMMLSAPLRAGASPAAERQPRPATSQLRHMSPRLPCSCHRNRRCSWLHHRCILACSEAGYKRAHASILQASDAECHIQYCAGTKRRLRTRSAGLPACCAEAGSDGANEDGAGKHGPQSTVRAASAEGSRSLWARGLRVGMPQDSDGGKGEHDGKFVIDRDGNRIEVMFHDYGETYCLCINSSTNAAKCPAETSSANGLASSAHVS